MNLKTTPSCQGTLQFLARPWPWRPQSHLYPPQPEVSEETRSRGAGTSLLLSSSSQTPTRASSSARDFSRMPMAPATLTCPIPLQPSSRLGLRGSGDDCNRRGPETVPASGVPGLHSARAAHTATPGGPRGLPWMCDPQVVLRSGAHTGQSHTRRVYLPEPPSPTLPMTGAHPPLPLPRPSGASPRRRLPWTIGWERNKT